MYYFVPTAASFFSLYLLAKFFRFLVFFIALLYAQYVKYLHYIYIYVCMYVSVDIHLVYSLEVYTLHFICPDKGFLK